MGRNMEFADNIFVLFPIEIFHILIERNQPFVVRGRPKAVSNSRQIKARGGVRGQKNKYGLYQSPICHGVTTFYGITKSSFMTKIWRVKVRGYYSVPYKI